MNRRDLLKTGIGTAMGLTLAPTLASASPDSGGAIGVLRADYLRRVRDVAALALREKPEIATMEGDEENGGDTETAAYWLEGLCRERLCPTPDAAWTVFLVSPHRPPILRVLDGAEEAPDVRDDACLVAAHDVIDVIGARWYTERWSTPPDVLFGRMERA